MVSIKPAPVKGAKHGKVQKTKNMQRNTKIEKVHKKKIKNKEPAQNAAKKILPFMKDTEKLVTPINAATVIKQKKRGKYVMPSKSITEDLVIKCLNALQQLSDNYKNKRAIFDDEQQIFVEIQCMKIQKSKGHIKFVLPHSTVASTGEVCFITPDLRKGKKPDHEPTIDHWENLLRKAGVTQVKTVLPMRQLRVEYDQYELKRRLMTQHDFIMVDTRVLNHVSHVLGKMFFQKHNMLIPVRINEKRNLKKDIDIGLHTTTMQLSDGSTSILTVGHTGMSQVQLKENIMSLVGQLKEKYPGGQANIRSISIKLPLSLSLPLYITLRPANTVNTPKLKKNKPKNCADVEDELSTLISGKVCVAPDGTVKIKRNTINQAPKQKSDLEDMEEEIQSEEEVEDSDEDDKIE